MPAAIQVTAAGQPFGIATSTTVQLTALPANAIAYAWSFIDKPAGSSAVIATPTLQHASFVLDVVGSYFVRCLVTGPNGVEEARSLMACSITTDQGSIRIPASGEVFEADASKGWALALQQALKVAIDSYNLTQATAAAAKWRSPAKAGSLAQVALTGASPLTVDDITLTTGDRLLLRAQTDDKQNGIYAYAEASGVYTLTRATDADTGAKLVGSMLLVQAGTVLRDQIFQQTADAITLGVTPIVWLASGLNVTSGIAALVNDAGTRKLRWTDGADVYEVVLTHI